MGQRKPSQKRSPNKTHKLVHNKFGIRIAHHQHSGRRMPLQYTSYTLLFFLIALLSLALLFARTAANAYEQVGQGSIALGGFSKGPPPENAAEITQPADKSVFEENIIELKGTCEPGLFLEIFRNSVLAGGSLCKSDGTFRVRITLVPGKNDLQVRIHDALWQYGPDSKTITVWYNIPLPPVPALLVYTKPIQKGMFVDQTLVIDYVISGGAAPYAVSISWGDDKISDVTVAKHVGTFQAKHKYDKNGQYVITITVTDERGTRALIESIVVVHKTGDNIPFVTIPCQDPSCPGIAGGFLRVLDWAWPAVIIACLMTASFWIGEKIAYTHRPLKLRTH